MTRHAFAFWLMAALVGSSCATSRKVSKVELRDPASVARGPQSIAVEQLRQSMAEMSAESISKQCPSELRSSFSSLAQEKLSALACPKGFAEHVQRSLPLLRFDERSMLEAVGNSGCQVLDNDTETFQSLLNNFDSSGPLGRQAHMEESFRPMEEEIKLLHSLKEDLDTILSANLPIDRWIRDNGAYLLGAEDFQRLHEILVKRGCVLEGFDLEDAYQTMQHLEGLLGILKDKRQKEILSTHLLGLHNLLDNRVMEFFFPHGKY